MEFFSLSSDFLMMFIRLLINMLATWLIIDRLYYQKSKRRDFYFTFMLISVAIFFIVFFMIFVLEDMKGKTSMGVGIGLFGIFSIMRYRTDTMPVREMTYLFVVVCLSVVHAMADQIGIDDRGKILGTSLMELATIDVIVIACIVIFEQFLKVESSKLVQYDRIELVKKSRRKELIADLEERLEIKVTGVKVGAVDFMRDMAVLRVYYEGDGDKEIDNKIKIKNSDYANV